MNKTFFETAAKRLVEKYPEKDLRDFASGVVTRNHGGFVNVVYCYTMTELLDVLEKASRDEALPNGWTEAELLDACERVQL